MKIAVRVQRLKRLHSLNIGSRVFLGGFFGDDAINEMTPIQAIVLLKCQTILHCTNILFSVFPTSGDVDRFRWSTECFEHFRLSVYKHDDLFRNIQNGGAQAAPAGE